jgi:hypothetical protein
MAVDYVVRSVEPTPGTYSGVTANLTRIESAGDAPWYFTVQTSDPAAKALLAVGRTIRLGDTDGTLTRGDHGP